MTVLNSTLKDSIIKTITLEEGSVFIFEDFVITEFNEGTTINEECFLHLYHILTTFGEGKDHYGLIHNRIHGYTVNMVDLLSVSNAADKLYTSAVVAYDEATKRTTAFEKKVYNSSSLTCSDLKQAVSLMYNSNDHKLVAKAS